MPKNSDKNVVGGERSAARVLTKRSARAMSCIMGFLGTRVWERQVRSYFWPWIIIELFFPTSLTPVEQNQSAKLFLSNHHLFS